MLTEEQLQIRRTGISATDMVVLAGVSPYGRTPADVYCDKLGLSEPGFTTQAMSLGNRLEPVALSALADARNLVLTPGTTERHPIVSWLLATPDANVLDAPGGKRIAVAEAKAVGMRMAHRWGDDGDADAIPDEVRVQVQVQMAVTSTKLAHVVALIGTEARFYEVEHDDELALALMEIGERFWTRHVLAKVPPPLDGSESSARMVRSLFRKSSAGMVEAPAGADDLVREYLAAKDAEAEAHARATSAQAQLCAIIAEHEGLLGEGWTATWKERASGGVDYKALSEALGATKEMIANYQRPGGRVFLCKPTSKKTTRAA